MKPRLGLLLIGTLVASTTLWLSQDPTKLAQYQQEISASPITASVRQFFGENEIRLSTWLTSHHEKNAQKQQPSDTAIALNDFSATATQTANDTATQDESQTETATPIESIVIGRRLASDYTYSFAKATPEPVRSVFLAAVKEYNDTGLVSLVPGALTDDQNHIVFGTYLQRENPQQGTLELGRGGPQIIVSYQLFASQAINHGTANLNIAHPVAIAQSVAVHELGHALGLDHSNDRHSVMYPINQGLSQLTSADFNSLRQIYQH